MYKRQAYDFPTPARRAVGVTLIGITLIALWYYVWGYEADKYVYNPSHPYVVILPIVGYIFIRNAHPILQGYYSSVMAWFGGITLETYVLQFHILMCHNVQHILVIFPWPVLNTCIVSTVFVVVSWFARKVTIELQKKVSSKFEKRAHYIPVHQDEPKNSPTHI